MKKIFNLMLATLIVAGVFAQVPYRMSYQTVIRNAGGALVANQPVGIQISILQGSSTGSVAYLETHNVTTNANGLASLEIGGGVIGLGSLSTLDWSAGPYFVKSETDPAGGTNYSITGTSELLSVPYAFSAGNMQWRMYGGNISNTNSGNVGIGTLVPAATFDIRGKNQWDLVATEGDLRVGDSLYRLKVGVATAGGGAGDVSIMQYGQPGGYNVLSLGSMGQKIMYVNGTTQRVGIGTDVPNTSLDVRGTFSVVDGTQGAGKVLTSDASGNATWATPPAAPAIGFMVYGVNPSAVTTGATLNLTWVTENFDDGNNFSSTGFTAPSAGVYHFDGQILWSGFATASGYTSLVLKVNGAVINEGTLHPSALTFNSNTINSTLKLAAGDVVTLGAFQSSGASQNIANFGQDTYFSGYKVY